MSLPRLPVPALYLIGGGLGLAMMFVAKLAHGTPFFWPLVLLAFAPVLFFADRAWRRTDETAREAHKFAWFWGGSVGLTVALVAAEVFLIAGVDLSGLASLPAGAQLGETRAPAALFVMGVFFAALVQLAFTALTWAGWWLSKR